MATTIQNPIIIQGQSFSGIINLKTDDGCTPSNILPYIINPLWTIEVHFPGDPAAPTPAPVVLSTANAGEITIINAAEGQISYLGGATKSLLMNTGKNLTIMVKVIKDAPTNNLVDIFEMQKVIDIKAPDIL